MKAIDKKGNAWKAIKEEEAYSSPVVYIGGYLYNTSPPRISVGIVRVSPHSLFPSTEREKETDKCTREMAICKAKSEKREAELAITLPWHTFLIRKIDVAAACFTLSKSKYISLEINVNGIFSRLEKTEARKKKIIGFFFVGVLENMGKNNIGIVCDAYTTYNSMKIPGACAQKIQSHTHTHIQRRSK